MSLVTRQDYPMPQARPLKTPIQALVSPSDPDAIRWWGLTADLIRLWADTPQGRGISEEAQAETLCAHLIRIWGPAILDAVPYMEEHAVALRATPCEADWRATAATTRVCRKAIMGEGWPRRIERGDNLSFLSGGSRAIYSAFVPSDAALAASNVLHAASTSATPLSAFRHAAESWIALALPPLPPAVVALGVLDFRAPPAAPESYAVAWDALGGDLPTWRTEDASYVRDGTDGKGQRYAIPRWARRTALARCLVRQAIEEPRKLRGVL